MQKRQVAREISYAHSAETRRGRAVVRVLENTTGRIRLIRRAKGYEREVEAGRSFWDVMVERYGIRLEVTGGSLDSIPAEGPLVLVANHPYGILDGLMMGHILQRTRGDFRILAHQVFRKAEDLNKVILPISFDDTKEAARLNLKTRSEALRYLADGGAIGIFPGGTVSTAAKPFTQPIDPVWRSFTSKMVTRTGATVVPIFFEGSNSRLFQLASHLHYTLRVGLLIREFKARVGQPVRVVVGDPIDPAEIEARRNDARSMMAFLRKSTYELSPNPIPPGAMGFEFEAKYKDEDVRRYL